MIRLTRALAASALAACILLGSGIAAQAQDPVTIPPGTFLVDKSDVLTPSEEKKLSTALQDLTQDTGQSLFIIYVDKFSNPSNAQKWLGATADRKGLGSTDSMLVVATDQRSAQFESHSDGAVAPYDDKVFSKYTKPKLAKTDWLGAGLATVEGVSAAAQGEFTPDPDDNIYIPDGGVYVPGPITTGSNSAVNIPFKILGIVALWTLGVIGLIILTVQYFTRGWNRRLIAWLKRPKLEDLKREAGTLLFALDNSVTKMAESSMFAMAQYGKGVTSTLDKDLNVAKTELSRLFKLQKDAENSTTKKSAVRTILADLISSATKTQEALNAHQHMLEGLAEEEANISSELKRQTNLLTAAEKSIVAQGESLERAESQYEPEALSAIQRSTRAQSEALQRLRPKVAELNLAVTSGKTAEAVGLSHLSREAQGDLENVTEALAADWNDLRASNAKLDKFRQQVSAAIVRSKDLISSGYRNQLEQSSISAKSALDVAGSGSLMNPVAKHAALSSSTAQFLRELERVEAEVAAINMARRELPGLMANASQTIAAADRYIANHRRDVGGNATSMLTAARGQLQMAELNNTGRDLRVAHGHAADALGSAQKAQRRASSDVSDAEQRRRRDQQMAAAALTAAAVSVHHNNSNNFGGSSGFGGGGSGGSFGGGGSGFGGGGAGGNF